MKILFLDYDGCLHADDVYLVDGVPVMRRDGAQIFEHANLLAEMLSPYPNVQIVLSTNWVAKLGFVRAKLYLPAVLQQRVVGTTHEFRSDGGDRLDLAEWLELARFDQIMRYVRGKGLEAWLALDDDNNCWPESFEHHLVCPMPRLGLGDARVQTELADKLAQMCRSGGH
ncbi:hypothetical protein GJQ57_23165 [Ralstonia pickettii]|uniref:Uncharacterized protein n=1 Tax=Ralstonia pickettii TaxID=329 RepID=A0A7X2HRY8_RALPI|nr:HAD domain-containing protein [Ralstonia pickettii]MRT01548.1 hypothetical protein [Ralstonia pickettii]